MQRVAIVGPGLLGGSLALALKRAPDLYQTRIWARRTEAVEEARALGVADLATADLGEAVDGADLIFLCTPVGVMPRICEQIAPNLRADAVVTDVGSVKAPVVTGLTPIFAAHGKGIFIGSHPMAGSEQTGIAAARADLFKGCTCILTPGAQTPEEPLRILREIWTRVGCRLREMGPEAHDQAVGLISHLPHLTAAAMVNAVAELSPEAFHLVGPGFRDTTRVASGSPIMWEEILRENGAAVVQGIDALIAKLLEMRSAVRAGAAEDVEGRCSQVASLQHLLSTAKAIRDGIQFPSPPQC